jgi:hypothetical protein
VKHRMRLGGSSRNPFTPGAVEAIHRCSGGTPRVINTLCDNALFEAFLNREADISGPLVEQIAGNLGLEFGPAPAFIPAPPASRPPAEARVSPAAAPLPAFTPPAIAPPPSFSEPPVAESPAPEQDEEAMIDSLGEDEVQMEVVEEDDMPPISDAAVDSALADSIAQSVASEGMSGEDAEVPTSQSDVPAEEAASPDQENGAPEVPSKPRAGVDLAEIDRYLEGLGKL